MGEVSGVGKACGEGKRDAQPTEHGKPTERRLKTTKQMPKQENMAERDFKEVLPNGVSFEMVFVEGGAFRMGSKEKTVWREAPIHGVKLDSFYIGKFPVTQALWKTVMKDNPSFFNGDTRPVESVSWEDVQVFIKKLNEHTGKPYRLPTEAEWEYAARGGRENRGCTFAGSDKLKEVGW